MQEFKELTHGQLVDRLDQFHRELFTLKLNSYTSHVKDYSQVKKLKKNIARVLTLLNAKSR